MAESVETFTALLDDFKVLSSGVFSGEKLISALSGRGINGGGRSAAVSLLEPDTTCSTQQVLEDCGASISRDSESFQVGAQQRHVRCGVSDEACCSSSSPLAGGGPAEVVLARDHVGDAGHSLPALAGQLMAAHTTQDAEMSRRLEELDTAKTELSRARECLQSVQRDIFATNKCICLAQDAAAQMEHQCRGLEEELQVLVRETQGATAKMSEQGEEGERLRKLQEQYRGKVLRHKALVEKTEQSLAGMKELIELEARLAELKRTRCSYMQGKGLQILSGERQAAVQEHITAVKSTRLAVQAENVEQEQRVAARRECVRQLRTEVEMAQKRHGAQSTRLHRQLQEAQVRRRQWGAEAERLREAIAQLQHKIEE